MGYSPKQHRCCWASQTMNGHLPDAQRFVRFGSVVHSDVLIAPASLNGVRTAACPASHAPPCKSFVCSIFVEAAGFQPSGPSIHISLACLCPGRLLRVEDPSSAPSSIAAGMIACS